MDENIVSLVIIAQDAESAKILKQIIEMLINSLKEGV